MAPSLLYGADLFTTRAGATARLNTFRHKVQRWTTIAFSATLAAILALESGLPPVPLLKSQRQSQAALRVICSPPEVNPATARLHSSFPSLSGHRARNSSGALTTGLKSVDLPLNWKTPRPAPPIRNHLPIHVVAHRTIPFTHGLSRMPMINSHLVSQALAVPPPSLMDNTYSALKKRMREALLEEWSRLFPAAGYYHHPPSLSLRPFMGLNKFIAGRIH